MNIDIIGILMNLAAFILAGSIHEWAHAFSAYIMGDNTARDSGRMNLNPSAHVDVLGTLLLPIFRAVSGVPVLGWMKPVPVNPYNFRNASKGMALSAIAGPLSNLFQAAFAIIIMKLLILLAVATGLTFIYSLYEFAALYYSINISLVVFNMLPVPPLDGSKLLRHGLSAEGKIRFDQLSRYGGLLLYVLLFAGVLRVIITPLAGWTYALLYMFLALPFVFSFIPLAAVAALMALIYRPFLHNLKMHLRFGMDRGTGRQAEALFTSRMSRIRGRNEELKKTAGLLLEKKKEGTLSTMIDRKMLERIESRMDSFSKLCSTRTIIPQDEQCLDCSYYANCLMRELNLTVLSGEES